MNTVQTRRVRIILTGLILLAELLHLAWEYTHGGVKSHHLLNRSDLPAISNWWGALWLPVLSWLLLGYILPQALARAEGGDKEAKLPVGVILGFGGSLLYGLLLAIAFTHHQEAIASYLFLGIFLAAALVPAYRAEYMLGFVLGMTFTFGAVLPTLVGSLVAAVSAVLHFLARQLIWFVRGVLIRKRSSTAHMVQQLTKKVELND